MKNSKTIKFGKLVTLFNNYLEDDKGFSSFADFIANYTEVVNDETVFTDLTSIKASKNSTVNFGDGSTEYLQNNKEKYASIISYISANCKTILDKKDQKFVDSLLRGIIERFFTENIAFNFSKEEGQKLVETFNLGRETKLEKRHDKLTWVWKKVIVPILVTAGVGALVGTALAFLPVAPGVFLTGRLVADAIKMAVVGAVAGGGLTASIIGIKNSATRNYYRKKYGIEANNIEEVLKDSVSIEDISTLDLDIVKLLDVINKTDEKIANSRGLGKIFNYARKKQNRNRLHALQAFIDDLNNRIKLAHKDSANADEEVQKLTNELTELKSRTGKQKASAKTIAQAEELIKNAGTKRDSKNNVLNKLFALKDTLIQHCEEKAKSTYKSSLIRKIMDSKTNAPTAKYWDILLPILRNEDPRYSRKGKIKSKHKKNVNLDNEDAFYLTERYAYETLTGDAFKYRKTKVKQSLSDKDVAKTLAKDKSVSDREDKRTVKAEKKAERKAKAEQARAKAEQERAKAEREAEEAQNRIDEAELLKCDIDSTTTQALDKLWNKYYDLYDDLSDEAQKKYDLIGDTIADREEKEEAARLAAEKAEVERKAREKAEKERKELEEELNRLKAKAKAEREAEEKAKLKAQAEAELTEKINKMDLNALSDLQKEYVKKHNDKTLTEEDNKVWSIVTARIKVLKAERAKAEKEEADRKAREEAERKAQEEAEKAESERKAKEEAERRAQAEAEKAEAERKAREEAERRAKEAEAKRINIQPKQLDPEGGTFKSTVTPAQKAEVKYEQEGSEVVVTISEGKDNVVYVRLVISELIERKPGMNLKSYANNNNLPYDVVKKLYKTYSKASEETTEETASL